MAYRKSSAIGDLHGRVDDVIFRTRYGKNIAYARPLNQKVSDSKEAIKARSNFAAANYLACAVNSVPLLKEVWGAAKVTGSNSFQKLVSMNTRLAREGGLSVSNVITPPGKEFSLDSVSIEEGMVNLSFWCPDFPGLTFPAQLFVFLYFRKSDGGIAPMVVEVIEPEPNGAYGIQVVPDGATMQRLAEDPEPIVYAALVSGKTYKRKVYWTSTDSVEV